MPILASLYAVFLALIALVSAWSNAKEGRPVWFTTLELVSDSALLLLFCAYWTLHLPAFVALPLYAFSIGWFFSWIPRKLTQFEEEEISASLTPRQRRIAFAAIGSLALPGYVFGGITALRTL